MASRQDIGRVWLGLTKAKRAPDSRAKRHDRTFYTLEDVEGGELTERSSRVKKKAAKHIINQRDDFRVMFDKALRASHRVGIIENSRTITFKLRKRPAKAEGR